MSKPYPHERRIQKLAWLALALALALGVAQIATGDRLVLGAEVPAIAMWGALVVGVIASGAAIVVRIPWVSLAGAGVVVLAVVPAGELVPGILDYAMGLAFGAALLVFIELVHMTARYERAHKAVESEGVPEDHINRVTDEAVRTLAGRTALALGVAALAVVGAFGFALLGPKAWRDAVETTAPLGVALLGLVVLGGLALFILVRGARFPRFRSRSKPTLESEPHVE